MFASVPADDFWRISIERRDNEKFLALGRAMILFQSAIAARH
jgi:hypothetical protein